MKLEDKRAIDLTPSQVIRCRELSYGSEGYMEEDLMQVLHVESVGRHYRYSRALLVRENNNIIGWALLMPMHQSPRYSAYFFVDPLHRRRGCGKLLLQQANTWGSKVPLCFPDDSNEEFFDQYPLLHTR